MAGWMTYTTRQNNQSNCVECAKARSHLEISNHSDPTGFQCALQLYNESFVPNIKQCKTLSLLFPAVKKRDVPPSALACKGNYTCFIHRSTGEKVGTLMSDYCQESINVTQDAGNYSASWFRNQTSMRADLWWLCGDMKLRPVLPSNWQSSCALAQLLMPFHLFPVGNFKALGEKLQCLKRSTVPGGSFDNRVYLDSIGVLRSPRLNLKLKIN